VKKLLHWLAAIALLILLILGVRAWLLSRIFYQPEWYHDQQTQGEAWKTPADAPAAPADAQGMPPAAPEPLQDAAPSGMVPETRRDTAPARTAPATRRDSAPSRTAPEEERDIPPAGSTHEALRERASSRSVHSEQRETAAATTAPATPLQRLLMQQKEVRITADTFVPTLLAEMAGADGFDPYAVVRGAKTTIHPGRMIVELMVNFDEIPRQQLTPDGVRVLDQLRGMLPEKALQQVYIKGDLQPVASGDRIVLGGTSQISVGRFSFGLADLKSRFKIDPAIDMNHFAFRRFELREGYVLLQR